MNDFTKEELEQLIWLSKNIPYRMNDYPIFDKIQSMIDNYCEHKCPESRDSNAIESCPTCGEFHDN